MRYLLALLLVVIALPCYAAEYYVNAGDTRARNLPAASGYGTEDSPWITPSYAITQFVGNNDTLYIYGYSIPGDTDNYYQDYLDITNDLISIIGITVGSDSPTFSRRAPSSNTAWIYRYNSGTAFDNQIISGLRFTNSNAQYNGIGLFVASYKNTIVRDCIFDSISFTGTYGNGEGCITFTNYATSDTAYVYNNSFLNLKNVAPVKMYMINNSTGGKVVISNNSIRNATWMMNNSFPNDYQKLYVVVKDNIIDSVGYLSYNYWGGGANEVLYISYLNNDTYSVVFNDYATNANITINNSFSSNYNVDPQWKYAATDALAYLNYLQDTTSTTLTTGSSVGGLLGVPWGWSATSTTPSTTLNYLYRGMNLMQRFEIIRRR